ncbi:MAG: holin family protein [Methylomicrobium sp.]|nr:holin family protein [Methylomicrobium sp.]
MFGAISTIGNTISTVITRIWPDATESEKAKLALMSQELEQEFKLQLGQIETNLEQAKHTNVFVSGARPAILWICGAALAYASIIDPILRFAARVWFDYDGEFPEINTEITMQILLGMLGLGGFRSFEKYNRVNGDHR